MENFTWISQIPLVQKNQFPPSQITQLYEEESITPNELMILQFMAMVNESKHTKFVFSFQGIKRLTKLHQAKLGKAMNRLLEKNYVKKIKEGYMLTPQGEQTIRRLFLPQPQHVTEPSNTVTYKQHGQLRSYTLTTEDISYLRENLSGKWFGTLKYLACNLSSERLELEWANFDETFGFIAAKLWITPPNQITLETVSEDNEIGILALEQLREKIDDLLIKTVGQAPEYTSVLSDNNELEYYSSS